MPTCEHFIYTTAKTNLKTGYQIVAKSSGINDRLLNSMISYLYPLGVNPTEFTKSKSLLPIGKKHVAYSTVKNIGIGYDGRDGTLYNHTIIINKDDFAKIEYDTRILDKYFIEEYSIRGELDQLYIQPEKTEIDFEYLKNLDEDLLSTLLFYLFKKSRIAIVKILDEKLIQNVLSIIPPQIRFMAFSTLVLEPTRQTKYQLIQIPSKVQPKLQPSYININPDALPASKIKQARDIGIQNIIELIKQDNQKQLLKLYNDFEKITTQVSQIKRIKIKDIFDQEKYNTLTKNQKFFSLLTNVKNLYSSPEFNKASPRVIVTITKKIRMIVKKSLKEHEKNNLKETDLEKLMSISKILLDCLNYINQLSEKKMTDTIQFEVKNEIEIIELILKQYPETTSMIKEYEFNPNDYFKIIYENALHSAYSMALFVLGRKWW